MAFAAFFIIAELLTVGFFLLWFGIGAAVAGVLAILDVHPVWQWASFIVVSGVLFASTRRFAEKFTKRQPPGVGADRLIGKLGVALEDVDNIKNTGRVRIDKDEWRADGQTDAVIPAGSRVKVIGVDGTHLVVEIFEGGE
jgi:membrane protein implicated in regulation of membrane protease activity